MSRASQSAPASGLGALGDRFVALWRRCQPAGTDDNAESVWRGIEARYAEPHRHYHDAHHLAHCLRQFDLVADRLAQPDEVEAAIWFHDVILVPGRRDNEERSAMYFRDVVAPGTPPDFVRHVVDLILFTTHRTTPAGADHQCICDIDLSSFGSPWEQFMDNSRAIAAEFPGPREEYVRGETALLEALLRRPRIFLTDFFYDRCERQARENIRRFLELLAQPATP